MNKKIIVLCSVLSSSILAMEVPHEKQQKKSSQYQFVKIASNEISGNSQGIALADLKRNNILIASTSNVLIYNQQLQVGDTLGTQDTVQALLMLNDGNHLCSASGNSAWNPKNGKQSYVAVWDLTNNSCVNTYVEPNSNVSSLEQFNDTQIAVALSKDVNCLDVVTSIFIWDFLKNQVIRKWDVSLSNVYDSIWDFTIVPDPWDSTQKLMITPSDRVTWFENGTEMVKYVVNFDNPPSAISNILVKNNQVIIPSFNNKSLVLWDLSRPYTIDPVTIATGNQLIVSIANSLDDSTILCFGFDFDDINNNNTDVLVCDITKKTITKQWAAQNNMTCTLQSLTKNLILTAGGQDENTESFNLWDTQGNLLAQEIVDGQYHFTELITNIVDNKVLVIKTDNNGTKNIVELWEIQGMTVDKQQPNPIRKKISGDLQKHAKEKVLSLMKN